MYLLFTYTYRRNSNLYPELSVLALSPISVNALEYVARFDNDVQGHFKKLLGGEVDGQSDGCVYWLIDWELKITSVKCYQNGRNSTCLSSWEKKYEDSLNSDGQQFNQRQTTSHIKCSQSINQYTHPSDCPSTSPSNNFLKWPWTSLSKRATYSSADEKESTQTHQTNLITWYVYVSVVTWLLNDKAHRNTKLVCTQYWKSYWFLFNYVTSYICIYCLPIRTGETRMNTPVKRLQIECFVCNTPNNRFF
jgi:hypothetical protein